MTNEASFVPLQLFGGWFPLKLPLPLHCQVAPRLDVQAPSRRSAPWNSHERVFSVKFDPQVKRTDRQIIGLGFEAPIGNLLATGSTCAKNALFSQNVGMNQLMGHHRPTRQH